jgi:hypothetical protein
MDKRILDVLIKFGFVTNINVDPAKYKDVDDLINKGIITIPGAKDTINKLIKGLDNTETQIEAKNEPNNESKQPEDVTILDEPETSPELVLDAPDSVSPINDTKEDETPIENVPAEPATVVENTEIIEEKQEDIVVDEPESKEEETETPKKKKTKKSE